MPVQAGILEGLIECGTVAVTFSIGKRAVNVEKQGVECHVGCGGQVILILSRVGFCPE
jgi:hypothetical protein